MTRSPRSPLVLLSLWAPPVVLMGVIFALSAQPDLSSGLGTLDTVLRKLTHMAEYGLLVFLWWRALRGTLSERAAVAFAVAISLVYAGTDEVHQSFVEGRHGTPVDVLIDAVGIVAVSLLLMRRKP